MISHGNQKCYIRDGRTGPTYVWTAVILYDPTIENGGGIKKCHLMKIIINSTLRVKSIWNYEIKELSHQIYLKYSDRHAQINTADADQN